ncbi:uncharacterized protein LOC111114106 [Crassostrea virginica]
MAEKTSTEAGKSPGELFLEAVATRLDHEYKFSRQRLDHLRAPIKITISMGKIKENKVWRLKEDDWRFCIFHSYEDRRAQETFLGRVRLFFRDNFCCWVVPSENSCWGRSTASCRASTLSIPSTSGVTFPFTSRGNFPSTSNWRGNFSSTSNWRGNFSSTSNGRGNFPSTSNGRGDVPSTSTWRETAEEFVPNNTLEKVASSDGEVHSGCGYGAFWTCFKYCFLCCFTPTSCCVNALAHSQESINSIALPAMCKTPSTSGRAIIKVVETSLEKDKEEKDDDGEEENIIWFDCLTGLEGVSDTHDGGIIEKNMEGMKNGRIVETGVKGTDLDAKKLPKFPDGDKMEETKEKKGKQKKAGVCQCRPIYHV